jgi:lipid-A-disaccharide synthase
VPLQIAIITGEASGDRVGGQLAAEIKRLRPDAEVWGTGGKFLREAGAEVVVDSSRWGVVGAAQALSILPKMLRARAYVLKEMLRRKPDVLVAVDAGALHTGFGPIEGVLPWARKHLPGTRLFYYFPPGSWRRTLKGTPLAPLADAVATPFPWSESELRRLGVDGARFVGHPLLDLVRPEEPPAQFAERYGIDRDRPVVGILPGSRRQEISLLLPIQLEAAAIIHRRVPGVQFLLALAPTVDREDVVRAVEALRRKNAHLRESLRRIEDRLRDEIKGKRLPPLVTTQGTLVPPNALDDLSARTRQQLAEANAARPSDFGLTIVENATYGVMAAGDVLMSTSGTATLEAAILGRPMVIMYRLSLNNWVEYQLIKKSLPEFIGLPNLIAQKMICPEFVQDAATPEAISAEIIGLLLEPDRMLKMREALREAVSHLGEPGGAARAAQMVIALAERPTGPDGINQGT